MHDAAQQTTAPVVIQVHSMALLHSNTFVLGTRTQRILIGRVLGVTKPTSTAGRSVCAYRVDRPSSSDEVPINKGSLPQEGARAGTLPTLSWKVLACGFDLQTLICSAEIREITFGFCVDGRAFVKELDRPAAVKTRESASDVFRLFSKTPGLALTALVAQGVCRMR
jgi:hypothetical protein